MRATPSRPNHLPKAPPPILSHQALGFYHMNFGVTQTSDHSIGQAPGNFWERVQSGIQHLEEKSHQHVTQSWQEVSIKRFSGKEKNVKITDRTQVRVNYCKDNSTTAIVAAVNNNFQVLPRHMHRYMIQFIVLIPSILANLQIRC